MSRRTSEFGIRMALGAGPRALLASVMRTGLAPVASGIVAGLAASLALSRLLARFLFQVEPGDPLSFTVASGVLLLAGVAAALIPAYRASRVDPVAALRAE